MTFNIADCEGFQWDEGNVDKNWRKHRVRKSDCEEVFLNRPLMAADDAMHSGYERRYYVLGQTDSGRELFIAFTIRRRMIRVISARDMSKRERKKYYETIERNPDV